MEEPTADPDVVIEEQRPGYCRYRNTVTGARWIMYGTCKRSGVCMIGAVIDGVEVRDYEHLAEMSAANGGRRLISELDVPLLPETDCPNIRGEWLTHGDQ